LSSRIDTRHQDPDDHAKKPGNQNNAKTTNEVESEKANAGLSDVGTRSRMHSPIVWTQGCPEPIFLTIGKKLFEETRGIIGPKRSIRPIP
jgi:hypothetical protein